MKISRNTYRYLIVNDVSALTEGHLFHMITLINFKYRERALRKPVQVRHCVSATVISAEEHAGFALSILQSLGSGLYFCKDHKSAKFSGKAFQRSRIKSGDLHA